MLDLLNYDFVIRAIIASLIAGALLGTLGVFVNLRKMSFFSDGIAHASLAGIAIGILFHQEPLAWALLYSILFATAIYFLEKRTNLSPDSLIGILFTSSLALGVLLIQNASGYQPDLLSFLFGNILTIRTADLAVMAVSGATIAAVLFSRYRQHLLMTLNRDLAHVAGVLVNRLTFLQYILLAVAVVIGIKILGIVLVSALLIIPASTAKLVSKSVTSFITWSAIFAELAVISGLFLSLRWNLPTGSVIILCGAGFFILALIIRKQKRR